jgi:dihydrofolate synthase / folylpolyglutamate synthase
MDWDLEFQKIMSRLDERGVMPVKVPSLAPMEEALRRIGFYESNLYNHIFSDPRRSIIVAGTNGKGTVCATLEKLLSSQGLSVGVYTSPHLIEATERIRFAEADISKEQFCKCYASLTEKLGDLEVSHFETLTALAVEFFMECCPDYLIWEVGMGGVWDATNAIIHGTCVITPIDYDHEKFLGKSIEQIAANKLGVVRDFDRMSTPIEVIHYPLPKESEKLAQSIYKRIPSVWHEVAIRDFRVSAGPVWEIEVDGEFFPLSLSGKRAVENSSIALRVFDLLGYSPSSAARELALVRWPGRMEPLTYRGKKLFLSGDHNSQGIDSLLEILNHFKFEKIKILFGLGKEKNLESTLPKLFAIPGAQVHLTESPFKGLAISEFGEYQNAAQWCEADPVTALDRLCDEASDEDLVLVTGSLYLVGRIRAKILETK